MYEFKEQDAYDFARHIGAKAVPRNGELFFMQCPYCKPNIRDRSNLKSFSINLGTGQFKCLRDSCGVHGNMVTLSKDFDFSLGSEADEYFRPRKEYRKFKTPIKAVIPKPPAVEYLKSRGIPKWIAEKYEITVSPKNEEWLVMPFYDEKGILRFIKYRDTKYFIGKTYVNKDGETVSSSKEWCEANCKPILFGMKQCNKDDFETLIITEGQLDSLSVAVAGYENVVSVPTGSKGMTWVPYCWDWMSKFKKIIVFGDHEKGHITLLDEINNRFQSEVLHVKEEDYKECKDANEILQKYGADQIKVCIENAIPLPVERVMELADVENVDIYKLEKLKTGINSMDKLLSGGLPFGGVHIISGKPGEGKSTLASQILINAIEQGYKVFAYSGELANYLFKAWMDFQVAGPSHVIEYPNKFGDLEYGISDTNKNLITDWYRGRAFIYDNRIVDSNEKEDLLKTIVDVIMRTGARVILLDNLMTAIDLVCDLDSDKYERQSQFIKKLARIALRYDVMILLVAHKRKNNFSKNENDEISGSGDISNLATITIAYEKDNDIEEGQRLLKVSKNRLFGKINTKGWITNFNEKSKRIYGPRDDVNYHLSWEVTDSDGFLKLENNDEVPF